MKFLSEYRDADAARRLIDEISAAVTREHVLMEVCGGQTHAIVRYGIDRVLPPEVELVHGPGCPVCVTPLEMIDRAHAIAMRPGVTFCSYGDMLRVPGSHGDLLGLKSRGADVRAVYSPLDAVQLAERNPERQIVLFAIGFETTAPANAMALWVARRRGLKNFSALISQVLVPPAIASILEGPENRVSGFLGPGHVCTVMGTAEYEPIAADYDVPVVISGFEPLDLLQGLLQLVRLLEADRAEVHTAYRRAVRPGGNPRARELIDSVFEVCDRPWRGMGAIPDSGHRLRDEYRDLDAARRFDVDEIETDEPVECISGRVLQGLAKPCDCPAFATRCTPRTPLGATMVSAEGACAAYYAYRSADHPSRPASRASPTAAAGESRRSEDER